MPRLTELLARYDGPLRALCRAGFMACVGIVIVLSLLPGAALPHFRLSDKLAHMIAYTAIAAFAMLGYPARRLTMPLLAGVVALGGVLEIGQAFVPGRSTDLIDFAFNCAGVLLGYAMARAVGRIWAASGA